MIEIKGYAFACRSSCLPWNGSKDFSEKSEDLLNERELIDFGVARARSANPIALRTWGDFVPNVDAYAEVSLWPPNDAVCCTYSLRGDVSDLFESLFLLIILTLGPKDIWVSRLILREGDYLSLFSDRLKLLSSFFYSWIFNGWALSELSTILIF